MTDSGDALPTEDEHLSQYLAITSALGLELSPLPSPFAAA